MTDAGFSDTRQKANLALLELDKGLRSSSVGEQSEAIVQFPLLIDQFPFPILITNALLKLAEVFRTGNNVLQVHILTVVQQCEKHLSKLTNSDEFLKRIFAVTHSNDPIARAIVLRLFGCVAVIISERKNVHHRIQLGLESNAMVEVKAAIFAAGCFCQHSRIFANSIFEKIATMVEGLSTPVDTKLRLIPILAHLQHELQCAAQVRELCLRLLGSYPALLFVCNILQTLTKLATATVVHVSDQLRLLLAYVRQEPRRTVRFVALSNLLSLAKKTPHLWDADMIQVMVKSIDILPGSGEAGLAMKVLLALSSSENVLPRLFPLSDAIHQLCYHEDLTVACLACAVYANLAVGLYGAQDAVTGAASDVMVADHFALERQEAVELVLFALALFPSPCHCGGGDLTVGVLKVLLTSVTKLSVIGNASIAMMSSMINLIPQLNVKQASLLAEAMAVIGAASVCRSPSLQQCRHELLSMMRETPEMDRALLLPLSSLFMSLHLKGRGHDDSMASFIATVEPLLLAKLWAGDQHNYWLAYRIARQASHMGFHSLASKIYRTLSEKVTVHQYNYWLLSLMQLSTSQLQLISTRQQHASDSAILLTSICQLADQLTECSSLLNQSILLMKASSLPAPFPLQFLGLYTKLIDAYSQLIGTCVRILMGLVPSEVVSKSVEKWLQVCSDEFQLLSQNYTDLYSTLFDADQHTLTYIEQLQQSCMLMAHVISCIALSKKPLVSPARLSTPTSKKSFDVQTFDSSTMMGRSCGCVLDHAQSCAVNLQSLPISSEHASVISHCAKTLLQVPLTLPKYFFNRHQKTSIKLDISPSPETDEAVSVLLTTLLTLSVEGVVEHSRTVAKHRRVCSSVISVTPTLKKALKTADNLLKVPKIEAQEKQEPVASGYFKAQFLFSFPSSGYYELSIRAGIVDELDTIWSSGQTYSLMVLAGNEETLRQYQHQKIGTIMQPQEQHAHKTK